MTLAAAMTVSLSLGCLLLSLLQHMVHARWGVLLIRVFERGIGPWSFGVVALSLMPLLIHPALVYAWARGEFPVQAWWLSLEPFRLRAALYLLFWLVLSSLLRRATRQNCYATNLAAPGFFLVCLTGTFAAFDWVMSLELPFVSSVYGMLFLAAGVLGAMGLGVATLCWIERSERFDFALRRDYANLLFTMVMVWAYLAFVQYLICWSGNLKDEVPSSPEGRQAAGRSLAMPGGSRLLWPVLYVADSPYSVVSFRAWSGRHVDDRGLGMLHSVDCRPRAARTLVAEWGSGSWHRATLASRLCTSDE